VTSHPPRLEPIAPPTSRTPSCRDLGTRAKVGPVLQSARFTNFKALQDLSLDLERLTVLVGANGCGKTSVLEAIDLACKLREPIPDEDRSDGGRAGLVLSGRYAFSRLHTSGSKGPLTLHLKGDIEFTVSINDTSPPSKQTHFMSITGPIGGDRHEPDLNIFLQKYGHLIPVTLRLRLNAETIAAPSFIEPGQGPILHPDGSGLASMLAYLAARRSPAFDRIEAALRSIVPRVETLRIEPETITRDEIEYVQLGGQALPRHVPRSYSGHRIELGLRGAGFLRAEAISEGTLLALGLLTVLHADKAPSLVLIDDLDRGLHPTAQRAVFACLRQLLDARPDLQIVCTTHSPYALDCVRPEEVRILKLDADGHAHARKLTDHPEWPQWKGHMAPGEFWSSYGEDWVYGVADDR
jgi:predicted ATPase